MLLRHWFLLILILKLASSACSWALPNYGYVGILDFSSAWIFGFWIPVFLLLLYVFIGFMRNKRNPNEASDIQFADSCYYLGFIFTVSSIIFALFDIHDLDYSLTQILMRFGAAMLCTVIGLAVRVFLIGFKKTAKDHKVQMERDLSTGVEHFGNTINQITERLSYLANDIDNVGHRVNKTFTDVATQFAESADNKMAEVQEALEEVKSKQIEQLTNAIEQYNDQINESMKETQKEQTTLAETLAKARNELVISLELQKNQLNDIFKESQAITTGHLNNSNEAHLAMMAEAQQSMSTIYQEYARMMEKMKSDQQVDFESHKQMMEQYFRQTAEICDSMTCLNQTIESLPASLSHHLGNLVQTNEREDIGQNKKKRKRFLGIF